MYHQCIKFPHNRIEVTILADSAYNCNNLKQAKNMVPHNKEALRNPKTKHCRQTMLDAFQKDLSIKEIGKGEY